MAVREFLPANFGFPPASIVPPMFHTTVPLNITIYRRTKAQRLVTFKQSNAASSNEQHRIEKSLHVVNKVALANVSLPVILFPLLVSFHQRFILAFISTLFLSQRQENET